MGAVCATCSGYLKNTGVPADVKPFGRVYGMYYVPLTADDGTRNSLDTSAVDLDAELLGKINEADPSKRWYPLLDLKNVAPTEADATFETDDTNQRFKTLDGIKTMAFEKWGSTRQEFAQLEDVCVDFGVVLIDNCGNLLGEWDITNDLLYPRKVNKGSYNSNFMNATATTSSKIMIEFDYDIISSDADQYMLAASSFDLTTNDPRRLEGMIDVNISVVSVDSNTTVTLLCSYNYGTVGNLLPFLGASASDFTLYNNTADSAIAVDSISASATVDGQYQLTMAAGDAPTAADEIEADIFRAATSNDENGFEGVAVTFDAV